MPADENGTVIPITQESLERMPKRIAKRLKPGVHPVLQEEFHEWVQDMGYTAHVESPMVRQLLFEAFVGGWGSKTRQIKRKKRAS